MSESEREERGRRYLSPVSSNVQDTKTGFNALLGLPMAFMLCPAAVTERCIFLCYYAHTICLVSYSFHFASPLFALFPLSLSLSLVSSLSSLLSSSRSAFGKPRQAKRFASP